MEEKDKAGWKTSEAWAALIPVVLPMLKDLSDVKFVATCAVLVAYIVGRSWAKRPRKEVTQPAGPTVVVTPPAASP